MNSKKRSENVSKQTVRNGLKTVSSSNVASQNCSALAREKTKVRASSAKNYDIASTILGGSTDVEELFLNSAKVCILLVRVISCNFLTVCYFEVCFWQFFIFRGFFCV